MLISTQLKTLGEPTHTTVPWASNHLLLEFSALSSWLRETDRLFNFPCLCCDLKTVQAVCWSNHRAHFVFFSLKDQCPLLPNVQCLKTIVLCNLSILFSCLRQEGKPSTFYSIMIKRESQFSLNSIFFLFPVLSCISGINHFFKIPAYFSNDFEVIHYMPFSLKRLFSTCFLDKWWVSLLYFWSCGWNFITSLCVKGWFMA